MTLVRFVPLLTLVTVTLACDVDGRRFPIAPTAPTPPTAAPTPPTPTAPIPPTNVGNGTRGDPGDLTHLGRTHPRAQCPPGGLLHVDDFVHRLIRANFDVQVESDIAAAAIIVGFYDGPRQCGVASVSGRVLAAGVAASLETATVFLPGRRTRASDRRRN